MLISRFAAIAAACAIALTVACSEPVPTTNATPGVDNANANANSNAAPVQPTFAAGSPQDIALHQPDYQATVAVQGGVAKLSLKIAKRGDAYRIEQTLPGAGNTITYIRPGQPTIQVLVDKKQYLEYPGGDDANPVSQTLKGLTTPGLKIVEDGTSAPTADVKYQTKKFRVTKPGEDGYLELFAAPELRNLIIKISGQKENVTFNAVWSDISLDPPAETVAPPSDLATAYQKIDEAAYTSLFSTPDAASRGGDGGGGTAPGSTKP